MSSTKPCFLMIHKAPPELTRIDFEAKMDSFADALAALPIVQKNLLKLDLMSQNTLVDDHRAAFGFQVPATTVLLSAEYKTMDGLVEMLTDATVQKLFAEADEVSFHHASCAFATDIVTKIDVPGTTQSTHVICIFNRPPNLSAEQFTQEMDDWIERLTALPVQERLSSYIMWLQNDSAEAHLLDLGYQPPDPLVVLRLNSENLEHMLEVPARFRDSSISTQQFSSSLTMGRLRRL
ncbi:hypothetical protein DFH09DRAFT_329475 [Mycena vulgaris]|nr:hypothetical protein DFH09DRAFT_329475 [Mycena vulgaris]